MVRTNIFAGGICHLTDARYFAARGAQFIIFNLEDTAPLSISLYKAAAIKEWVEGPAFVGAFQIADMEAIRFAIEKLSLQMVLAGPFISVSDIKSAGWSVPLIREVVIERVEDLLDLEKQEENLAEVFDYFLLNFEKKGISWTALQNNEQVFSFLRYWASKHRSILAIAHSPSETKDILKQVNPFGLYLQGSEEEKVGIKSYEDLDEILDLLEIEE